MLLFFYVFSKTNPFTINSSLRTHLLHSREEHCSCLRRERDYSLQEKEMKKVEDLLSFLENVPEGYRRGDWHPACVIILYFLATALALTLGSAVKDLEQSSSLAALAEEPAWLQSYRLGFGLYCIAVLLVLVCYTGAWVMVSYTITSWNLLWIRLLSAYFNR